MKKRVSRPKGTRDFLPSELKQRQFVIGKIRNIFELYGYKPLETPAIERWELLEGKLGQEGEQLLFKILRRGTKLDELRRGKVDEVTFTSFYDAVDLSLRYDLTLPFCRVVANNPQLPKPFKRYQIQPVWRADRPQRGRFWEFYQCDVDIAGSSSITADAEVINIIYRALSQFELGEFTIRINHRELLKSLIDLAGGSEQFSSICTALDKLDKIGREGVARELKDRGIPAETGEKIFSWLEWRGDFSELKGRLEGLLEGTPEGLRALEELEELFKNLSLFGLPTSQTPLDLSLVRGLDYYTGPIFEVVVDSPPIGSIAAGGRYDTLIERFSGQHTPATGASIGLERLIEVLRERGKLPPFEVHTELLVTVFSEDLLSESLRFAEEMRGEGIKTEVFLDPRAKLQKQIKYAAANGIPLIAILGPDELERGEVVLRTGPKQQRAVSREQAAEEIKSRLSRC